MGNIFVEKLPFSTGISEINHHLRLAHNFNVFFGLQDTKIWGVVQERVYQSRVHSIDELKQCLLHAWHGMDQSIIDSAVDEWRLRLRACVRAKAGHYEHLL